MSLMTLMRSVFIGFAVVVVILAVVVSRSSALHRDTPVFVQVSSQPTGDVGRIAGYTAEYWGFAASGDVMGNGNSGWQVFFFDLTMRVFQRLPGITQITFGSYSATSPSMSTRGSAVKPRLPVMVFEADGGLCGDLQNNCDIRNPNSGRQIFIYDTGSGRIRQVTRINGDAKNPHISGSGKFVLFDSTTNILGDSSIGTIPELYQGDVTRLGTLCSTLPCGGGSLGGVTKLTNGGGAHGSQSFNGNVIAFESAGDNANNGANPGTSHVYVIRKGVLKQLTSGTGTAGRRPTVSQNGKFIGFEWDRPATSGPPVSQIFVAKVRSQTVQMTQVTDGASGSHVPSIDPKARRMSFVSSADLLNIGSIGTQVFSYNVRRGKPVLEVSGGPSGSDISQSTTTAILGFASADDFTGTGNTTRQFFVANTFKEAPDAFDTPTPTRTKTPTPITTATPGPTTTEMPPAPTPTETP